MQHTNLITVQFDYHSQLHFSTIHHTLDPKLKNTKSEHLNASKNTDFKNDINLFVSEFRKAFYMSHFIIICILIQRIGNVTTDTEMTIPKCGK